MKIDLNKLQIEMAKRCMGVLEVAKQSNISKSTVYQVISSGRGTTKTIGKIAIALDTDVTNLLTDE